MLWSYRTHLPSHCSGARQGPAAREASCLGRPRTDAPAAATNTSSSRCIVSRRTGVQLTDPVAVVVVDDDDDKDDDGATCCCKLHADTRQGVSGSGFQNKSSCGLFTFKVKKRFFSPELQ